MHPSTASRVLNPATRLLVREVVALRVEAAANRLGYRPNAVAASLRKGQSMMIGVVLPDITNPVFPLILSGIEAGLETEGYVAIVVNAGDDPSRQALIVDQLAARRVDGLILATAALQDMVLGQIDLPFVLVNRADQSGSASSVVTDDILATSLAVTHLVELGHRRIAYLGGPLGLSTGRNRAAGFEAAMRSAGIEAVAIERAGKYGRLSGKIACARLLQAGPTAVVAANDLLALGCLDAFAAAGMRCPDDISLTGHNDMPLVDMIQPPLTTIRLPHWEMGHEAARLLLRSLQQPFAAPRGIVLKPQLIVRGSTAPG